eukprot:766230-Hanusia_phi.AAC.1
MWAGHGLQDDEAEAAACFQCVVLLPLVTHESLTCSGRYDGAQQGDGAVAGECGGLRCRNSGVQVSDACQALACVMCLRRFALEQLGFGMVAKVCARAPPPALTSLEGSQRRAAQAADDWT